MRNITNAENYRSDDYRQIVTISSGDYVITESMILQGSFAYDSKATEGEEYQIGTAIADEITFTIDNSDGLYGKNFIGVEFDVEIGTIPLDGSVERENADFYKLGQYIVVDVSETFDKRATMRLQDRLILFDTNIPSFELTTVYANLEAFCGLLDIPLILTETERTFLMSLPIYSQPANMTVRDFIRFCGLCMLENAYMTPNGSLAFRSVVSGMEEFTPANRYSSELGEPVRIGPVEVFDNNGNVAFSRGTYDGQHIQISSSSSVMFSAIGGISTLIAAFQNQTIPGASFIDMQYYPMTTATMSFWEAECGDIITYTDKDGNEIQAVITSLASVLNAGTSVTSGASSSDQKFTYYGKMTDEVKALINENKEAIVSAQNSASWEIGFPSDISFFVGTLNVNGGVLKCNDVSLEMRV